MSAQYAYAQDENSNIVHIDSVTKETRGSKEFRCISCGEPLTACLGDIRDHHFRHQHDSNCNSETYLHRLGKLTFKRIYEECIKNGKPYLVSSMQKVECSRIYDCFKWPASVSKTEKCCEYRKRTFNLTDHYDLIKEEERIGSVIPDLALRSSKDPNLKPLFIEIKVSHACDQSKIDQNYPIIEIELQSENDIGIFEQCHFEPDNLDRKISLYNSSGRHYYDNMRLGEKVDERIVYYNFDKILLQQLSKQAITHFITYRRSWKSILKDETIKCDKKEEIISQHSKEKKIAYEIFFYGCLFEKNEAYKFGLAKAFHKGFPIRNCLLCEFMSDKARKNEHDKSVVCQNCENQKLGIPWNSNLAVTCKWFAVDNKIIENYMRYECNYIDVMY